MEGQKSSQEQITVNLLADKLDELQFTENGGGGVKCVQLIVRFLREGNILAARNTASYELDKISSYPDIEELVERELIKEKL